MYNIDVSSGEFLVEYIQDEGCFKVYLDEGIDIRWDIAVVASFNYKYKDDKLVDNYLVQQFDPEDGRIMDASDCYQNIADEMEDEYLYQLDLLYEAMNNKDLMRTNSSEIGTAAYTCNIAKHKNWGGIFRLAVPPLFLP